MKITTLAFVVQFLFLGCCSPGTHPAVSEPRFAEGELRSKTWIGANAKAVNMTSWTNFTALKYELVIIGYGEKDSSPSYLEFYRKEIQGSDHAEYVLIGRDVESGVVLEVSPGTVSHVPIVDVTRRYNLTNGTGDQIKRYRIRYINGHMEPETACTIYLKSDHSTNKTSSNSIR
jgi:hypothetical protein